MKPHVFAAMVNEVRALARQYGQMEQFRCRVADLLGTYIRVEHNSKGVPEQSEIETHAVVVPEPTMFDVNREYFENVANVFTSAKEREAHKTGFLAGVDWFRARAIPADRVLGEGERKICSEEWMYLRSLERYARKHGPESIQDVIGCLDHLRANQGGAAT